MQEAMSDIRKRIEHQNWSMIASFKKLELWCEEHGFLSIFNQLSYSSSVHNDCKFTQTSSFLEPLDNGIESKLEKIEMRPRQELPLYTVDISRHDQNSTRVSFRISQEEFA